MSTTANAKELLLGFLEQISCFNDTVIFQNLLQPVQNVLQRLPGKRGKSLEWTLNTLNEFISGLPLPSDYNLEGDENKLLDLDPNVQNINIVIRDYIYFLEPFVTEVLEHIANVEMPYRDRVLHQKDVLALFLLKLFGPPLTYLDLSPSGKNQAKSLQYASCEKILSFLSKMYPNFLNLYDLINVTCSDGEEQPSNVLCTGTFAYLIFYAAPNYDRIPSVFSHQFLLEHHLAYIITFLKVTQYVVISKGLALAFYFLNRVPIKSLNKENLDHTNYKIVANMLVKIMIHCPVKELRSQALQTFNLLVNIFDFEARQKLVLILLNTEKHSGFQGYVIQIFKNNIHNILSLHGDFVHIKKFLKPVLKICLELPDGEASDLLEYSDRIMGALNILRYLYLRDLNNESGIWDEIAWIQTTFFSPLHRGLQLSRAHYKLERDNALKNKSAKFELSVSVEGQMLPNIPIDQQRKVLELALHTFDVMESILVRLEEIIETGKK